MSLEERADRFRRGLQAAGKAFRRNDRIHVNNFSVIKCPDRGCVSYGELTDCYMSDYHKCDKR